MHFHCIVKLACDDKAFVNVQRFERDVFEDVMCFILVCSLLITCHRDALD